jgi:hypothetical protein
MVVRVRVRGCDICSREREAVGDLESSIRVHTNDGSGGCGWEGCSACLNDFHDHLKLLSASITFREYEMFRTSASTWTEFRGISFAGASAMVSASQVSGVKLQSRRLGSLAEGKRSLDVVRSVRWSSLAVNFFGRCVLCAKS